MQSAYEKGIWLLPYLQNRLHFSGYADHIIDVQGSGSGGIIDGCILEPFYFLASQYTFE